MTQLAYERRGTGAPLVLLHGIGSSRHIWEPVVSSLAEQGEVFTIDLPGFGESAPLPAGVEPAPATIAGSVADLLDQLGITAPHVVGNSLGGWVGLELARMRPVASLTLLSSAGLWSGRTPFYTRTSLRLSRRLARDAEGVLSWLVRARLGRAPVLGQTHGRPPRVTPDQAPPALPAPGRGPRLPPPPTATVPRPSGPSMRWVGAPASTPPSGRPSLGTARPSRTPHPSPSRSGPGTASSCPGSRVTSSSSRAERTSRRCRAVDTSRRTTTRGL